MRQRGWRERGREGAMERGGREVWVGEMEGGTKGWKIHALVHSDSRTLISCN